MKKSFVLCGIAAVSLITALGLAYQSTHPEHGCAGLVPENDLYIPANVFAAGGISKAQFNQVLDRIESIYRPEIESMGDRLTVNRYWDDGTVNANATKSGKNRVITIYGGVARFPSMGIEGFALAVCHEMGHHLGGGPKYGGRNSWGATEGAADYYATLKCMRRYLAADDNATALKKLKVHPVAKAACQAQFSNLKDQLICQRASVGGEQLTQMHSAIMATYDKPNYDTPATYEVTENFHEEGYPYPQCRMDTYFQGMLCKVSENSRMSDTDYKQGSCYSPVHKIGARPRCWFFPN
ncbi:hypothetical protein [Bdellovibrio sp. HCB274]|uniref:hypothetical protein n=1 Tax=Bdellovibrio sp. HCB274 TaxID=3394361 RepID=UPI0039B63B5F